MQIDLILNDYKYSNILLEHHLEGLAYRRFKGMEHLQKSWLNIFAHGDYLHQIGIDLCLKFSDLIVLKGAALLDDIYDDYGIRFMSDIDVLISHEQINTLTDYLLSLNYQIIKQHKWLGDNFKIEFNKHENGREINIEVHTKLFYHIDIRDYESTYDGKIRRLNKEMMLVHLIGHCAHGHNFQKLYWLYDIYFYLQKYNSKLDLNKLMKLIKSHQLVKSSEATFYILDKYFELPKSYRVLTGSRYYHFLLDKDFLLNPNQGGMINYFLKHFLKDQFVLSFRYDLFWIKNRIEKIFKPIKKK